jgi:hypothetical protein
MGRHKKIPTKSLDRPSTYLLLLLSPFLPPRLKANRASQEGVAEEAPLFERSEFGRRASTSEKRRAPGPLFGPGSRPARALLVTFGKTKVTRASARKLLLLPWFLLPIANIAKSKSPSIPL